MLSVRLFWPSERQAAETRTTSFSVAWWHCIQISIRFFTIGDAFANQFVVPFLLAVRV
jgi:hypothetical protein